jgi:hypothetical protein
MFVLCKLQGLHLKLRWSTHVAITHASLASCWPVRSWEQEFPPVMNCVARCVRMRSIVHYTLVDCIPQAQLWSVKTTNVCGFPVQPSVCAAGFSRCVLLQWLTHTVVLLVFLLQTPVASCTTYTCGAGYSPKNPLPTLAAGDTANDATCCKADVSIASPACGCSALCCQASMHAVLPVCATAACACSHDQQLCAVQHMHAVVDSRCCAAGVLAADSCCKLHYLHLWRRLLAKEPPANPCCW